MIRFLDSMRLPFRERHSLERRLLPTIQKHVVPRVSRSWHQIGVVRSGDRPQRGFLTAPPHTNHEPPIRTVVPGVSRPWHQIGVVRSGDRPPRGFLTAPPHTNHEPPITTVVPRVSRPWHAALIRRDSRLFRNFAPLSAVVPPGSGAALPAARLNTSWRISTHS